MTITDVRVTPEPGPGTLRAYCSLVVGDELAVKDVKVIAKPDGRLFVAMPSRPLCDHCRCGQRTRILANFCDQCGERLRPDRFREFDENGDRQRPFADVVFPISNAGRSVIEAAVLGAYRAAK
jgi:stage V sporulation protein G